MVSVVRRDTALRWVAVAAGTALVVGVPTLGPDAVQAVTRLSSAHRSAPQPRALLALVHGSTRVAFSGLAVSRGGLALPDLPSLSSTASLLGGSTQTRVWWNSPTAWRSDVLTSTGEHDTYGVRDGTVSWDYEDNSLIETLGTPPARLPRADDLLPPQAARRLLSGLGAQDRVSALPGRRIAGHDALGLRVVPGDSRSTIGHADLWVLPGTGLPVALQLADRSGAIALDTGFLDLQLGPSPASALTPPSAPGADHDTTTAPDIASAISRLARWQLPGTLAGLPGTTSVAAGVATYGQGLVRIVVLPAPSRLAGQLFAHGSTPQPGSALTPESVIGGRLAAVGSGLLQAVVAAGNDGRHAYVIAGLVRPEVVRQAALQLLADPPPPWER